MASVCRTLWLARSWRRSLDVDITGPPPGGDPLEVILEEGAKAMRAALLLTEAEWRGRLVPGVRGYRTGTYSRSITNDKGVRVGNMIRGSVGTRLFYARYLEEGTGLYGPLHRWIVPVRAKALRFPQPGNPGFTLAGRQRKGRAGAMAKWVYAKRVRGIMPRRYARDAAMIAEPKAVKLFEAAGRRAAERLAGGA